MEDSEKKVNTILIEVTPVKGNNFLGASDIINNNNNNNNNMSNDISQSMNSNNNQLFNPQIFYDNDLDCINKVLQDALDMPISIKQELIILGTIYLINKVEKSIEFNSIIPVFNKLLELYFEYDNQGKISNNITYRQLSVEHKVFLEKIYNITTLDSLKSHPNLKICFEKVEPYLILDILITNLLQAIQNEILIDQKKKLDKYKLESYYILKMNYVYDICRQHFTKKLAVDKCITLYISNTIAKNYLTFLKFIFYIDEYRNMYLLELGNGEKKINPNFYLYLMALNFKYEEEKKPNFNYELNKKEINILILNEENQLRRNSERSSLSEKYLIEIIRDDDCSTIPNLLGFMDLILGVNYKKSLANNLFGIQQDINLGILSMCSHNQTDEVIKYIIVEKIVDFVENLFNGIKFHAVFELFSPRRLMFTFLKNLSNMKINSCLSKRILKIIVSILFEYGDSDNEQFNIIIDNAWDSIVLLCDKTEKINDLIDSLCYYLRIVNPYNPKNKGAKFLRVLDSIQDLTKILCEDAEQVKMIQISKKAFVITEFVSIIPKMDDETIINNQQKIFNLLFNIGTDNIKTFLKRIQSNDQLNKLFCLLNYINDLLFDPKNVDKEEIMKKILGEFITFIMQNFNNDKIKDQQYLAFQKKYMSFFMLFVQHLIQKQQITDLDNLFQTASDFAPLYEDFLQINTMGKLNYSDDVAQMFAQIIISFLKVFEVNTNIKTKKLLWQCIYILFSTLNCIPQTRTFFNQFSSLEIIFLAIYNVHQNNPFTPEEIRELFTIFLNFATDNQLVKIFGTDWIINDQFTLLEILDYYTTKQYWKYSKYVTIKYEFLVTLIVKLIFILDLQADIKLFYMSLIHDLINYSLLNSITCGKGFLISTLLIFIKVENDLEIKNLIATMIIRMMKVATNVCHITGILKAMASNYKYKHFMNNLSPATKLHLQNKLSDSLNHSVTLKIILNIIKTLTKEPELNESFVSFSGESSGLILTGVSIPNSFTITISFYLENLLCHQKHEIMKFITSKNAIPVKRIINYEDMSHKPSFSVTMVDGRPSIKLDYFSNVQKSDVLKKIPNNDLMLGVNLFYAPRIFGLYGKNNYSLEMLVEEANNIKRLVLDEKDHKGKPNKVIYEVNLTENRWYNLVLVYSKNEFTAYLDSPEPLKPIKTPKFNMNSNEISYLSLGCSLFKEQISKLEKSDSLHASGKLNDYFNNFHNLSGFLCNFAILKKEFQSNDVREFLKYIKTKNDDYRLPTIVNLKTMAGINKTIELNEHTWSSNDMWTWTKSMCCASNKPKKRLYLPFFSEDKTDNHNQKQIAFGKGLTHNEKFKFEDIFFSTGNIDIYFKAIEGIWELHNFLDSENKSINKFFLYLLIKFNYIREQLFCGWIEIITLCCSSKVSNSTEVIEYLIKDGMKILSNLTLKLIHHLHGDISMGMINNIRGYISTNIEDPKIQLLFYNELFLNLFNWSKCKIELQIYIFNKTIDIIRDNKETYECFKKSYIIKKLLGWIVNYLILNQSRDENDTMIMMRKSAMKIQFDDEKKIRAFRESIFNAIYETILNYQSQEILNEELKSLVEVLALPHDENNKLEFLQIIWNLINQRAFEEKSNLIKNLHDNKLCEVLCQILIQTYKLLPSYGMIHDTSLQYLNLLINYLIKIFNRLIFSNPDIKLKKILGEKHSEMPKSVELEFAHAITLGSQVANELKKISEHKYLAFYIIKLLYTIIDVQKIPNFGAYNIMGCMINCPDIPIKDGIKLTENIIILDLVLEKSIDFYDICKEEILKDLDYWFKYKPDNIKIFFSSEKSISLLSKIIQRNSFTKIGVEMLMDNTDCDSHEKNIIYSSFCYFLSNKDGFFDLLRFISLDQDFNFLALIHFIPWIFAGLQLNLDLKKKNANIEKMTPRSAMAGHNFKEKITFYHHNPDFIMNLIQLISYFYDRCSKKNSDVLIQEYDQTFSNFIEIMVSFCESINILYSTIPEIRYNCPTGLTSSTLLNNIEKKTLEMNGGVLFTITKTITKILKKSTQSKTKKNMIYLLTLILVSTESMASLKSKINLSNFQMTKLFKNIDAYLDFEGKNINEALHLNCLILIKITDYLLNEGLPIYLSVSTEIKERSYSSPINNIDMLKDLPPILLQKQTSAFIETNEQEFIEKLSEDKYKPILDGLLLILTIVNQTFEDIKLAALLTHYESSQKLNKSRNSNLEKKNNSRSNATPSSKANKKRRLTIVNDIETFLHNLEDKKRDMKLNATTISKNPAIDLFGDLHSICKDYAQSLVENAETPNTIEIKRKDVFGYLEDIFNHLMKSREKYRDFIIPAIKENILKQQKLINEINKFYFKIKKDLLRKKKDLFEAKRESYIIKDFDQDEDYKQYQQIYTDICNNYKNSEIKRIMEENSLQGKILQKWQSAKSKLTSEHGIWRLEELQYSNIIYKIEKTEDIFRRRMRLKIDKNGPNKRYLSYQASKEQRRNKSTTPSEGICTRNSKKTLTKKPSETHVYTVNHLEDNINHADIHNHEDQAKNNSENIEKSDYVVKINKEEFKSNMIIDPINIDMSPLQSLPTMTYDEKNFFDVELRKKETRILEEDGGKNTLILDSEKVSVKGVVWGRIELSKQNFVFVPSKKPKPNEYPFILGAIEDSYLSNKYKTKTKRFSMEDINEVHSRNYNLRQMSFEIFCSNGRAYFFNVFTQENQQKILKFFKDNQKHVLVINERAKEFEKAGYTKKWIEGKLTNFEYIMLLNTYAGRSYNDISQYPIFPWVIKDYSSSKLEIMTTDPKEQNRVFRDLSRPIGFQNEKRREVLEKKFSEENPVYGRFHYGTHYSTSGGVIGLLIRLEPFTTQAIHLQSNRFDEADRIFSSIPAQWDIIYEDGDVRELTPEFFYLPDVLRNKNKYDFGKKQNGRKVHDVELPNWAKTPEEFIIKHREALESDYVSSKLDEWIDLIFGYKQRNQEAEKNMNKYVNMCYDDGINLDRLIQEEKVAIESKKIPKEQHYANIKATITQINCFGQIPIQLFTTKHEKKHLEFPKYLQYNLFDHKPNFLKSASMPINIDKEQIQSISGTSSMNYTKKNGDVDLIHLTTLDKTEITSIFVDTKAIRLLLNKKDLYYISTNTHITELKWPHVIHKSPCIHLADLAHNGNNFKAYFSFIPSESISSNSFLIIGGFIDNRFIILKDKDLVQSVRYHKRLVTCVDKYKCPNTNQYLIVCGSKDCKITLWDFDPEDYKNPLKTPKNIIYGHHYEVSIVHIIQNLGLILSADIDGVILISCILSGRVIRTFYPKFDSDEGVKFLLGHDSGMIAIITTKGKIMSATINSSEILETKQIGDVHIKQALFISSFKPMLVKLKKKCSYSYLLDIIKFLTYEYKMMVFDLLKMEVVHELSKNTINQDTIQTKKKPEEIEKFLKGSHITCFEYHNSNPFLLLFHKKTSQILDALYFATDKGVLAFITKDSKQQTFHKMIEPLKDLGFDVSADQRVQKTHTLSLLLKRQREIVFFIQLI